MLSFFVSIYVITLIIGSLSACVCFVKDVHKFHVEHEKYSKQKMRSMSESIKAEFEEKEEQEEGDTECK